MTTTRQMLIARAVLIIIDSGNADVTDERIAGAIEGAVEINNSYRPCYEKLSQRAWKRMVHDIRAGALKHPRYQQMITRASGDPKPELVKAAETVRDNLAAEWIRIHGDWMPIQELGNSRVSDMLARNYSILERALRHNA